MFGRLKRKTLKGVTAAYVAQRVSEGNTHRKAYARVGQTLYRCTRTSNGCDFEVFYPPGADYEMLAIPGTHSIAETQVPDGLTWKLVIYPSSPSRGASGAD
jgi:hypothetical protein